MSIIYDALKKTEAKTKDISDKHAEIMTPAANRFKFLRIIYVICILIIMASIGFFMGKETPDNKSSQHSANSKERSSISVQVKSSSLDINTKKEMPRFVNELPPLLLTGLLFSNGEYVALINDRMAKEGDVIEGVLIKKIDSEGVDIEFKGMSFRLKYP